MISVITDISEETGRKGWVAYDAACALCVRWARRSEPWLTARGFGLVPLQAEWVRRRLALPEAELLSEMRLLLPDGAVLGGADAVVRLAREIWWAWPLWLAAQIPGAMPLLRRLYAAVAARRHCTARSCAMISHNS